MAPLDDVSAHPVRDDGLDGQPVLNPLNGVDASGAPVHKSASEDAFAQEAAIFPELPLVEVRYDFSVKVTVPRVRHCGATPATAARNSERCTCCTRRRCMLAAHAGDCSDKRAASTRRRPRGGDSARKGRVGTMWEGRPVPRWRHSGRRHATARCASYSTLRCRPLRRSRRVFWTSRFDTRAQHTASAVSRRAAPHATHTRGAAFV